MARRLIGTDTTGTDGSVTIPYTGTGAGLVQMDVETEIDGSIVSEPSSVLDCTFADMIDGVSNTKFWNNSNNIQITTNNGVKELTTTASANQYRPATEQTSDSTKVISFNSPFVWEFEVTEITGNWVVQVYDGSVNSNPYISSTGKYKVVYDGATVKCYKDDSTNPFSNKTGYTNLSVMLGFQCWSSGQTLKYKNFKIYPI